MYRYNGGGHIHRWLQDGSFPWEGQTISYGSCNRHIENIFSPLPGKWYFKGIKKAHGAKPRRILSPSQSRLLLSCNRRQKYEENPEPPNILREILKNSRIFLLKIRISGYFPCFWGGMRNEKEWKGMKRNEKEWFSGINRKMTGNDRKWPEKRANYERITSENDRKRPETTAGSPFGSATSRNGFLGNSPIFRAFSSIFRAYSPISQ